MGKRTIRVQKPKERRAWRINPVTRVVESKKEYRRSVEREQTQDLVSEHLATKEQRPKGRILGVDFGQRRVGLAVSDPLGITAQGLETIDFTEKETLLVQLGKIINELEVKKVVVGLPLNLDGIPGDKAKEVAGFIEQLKIRFQLPVIPWDERMTTKAAHRTMHEMGRKAKGAKGKIDRIAAILILQSYLDHVQRDEE